MLQVLHLTNGRAIIPKIRAAGLAGEIVPWDDVLHDGPVPAGLDVAELRDVRADFLSGTFDGRVDAVRRAAVVAGLKHRDDALQDALRGANDVAEIVLWHEHDLYDQLQVIQILDRVHSDEPPVTAVPDDDYLGTQPDADFSTLFARRRRVTSEQRDAARLAWQAFRSPDPRAILDVLPRVGGLSHLPAALRRHLQQFPSVENGLSRTEQQALEAIARGVHVVKDIYVAANHGCEEAVFLGDLGFMSHIEPLLRGDRPLIAVDAMDSGSDASTAPRINGLAFTDRLVLTEDGRAVLNNAADRIALSGIDRWLGGVHLTLGTCWRWDRERDVLRCA